MLHKNYGDGDAGMLGKGVMWVGDGMFCIWYSVKRQYFVEGNKDLFTWVIVLWMIGWPKSLVMYEPSLWDGPAKCCISIPVSWYTTVWKSYHVQLHIYGIEKKQVDGESHLRIGISFIPSMSVSLVNLLHPHKYRENEKMSERSKADITNLHPLPKKKVKSASWDYFG